MSGDFAVLGRQAARQGGAFSRDQALAAGLPPGRVRRLLEDSLWVPVLPDVYRAATSPDVRALREHAAQLWLPEGGLSHLSAAHYYRLLREPPHVWFSVAHTTRRETPEWLRLIRTRHLALGGGDHGLQVTAPTRTVVDLGMCLALDDLRAAFLAAVQSLHLDQTALAACARQVFGRAGSHDLSVVLAEFEPAFESILGAEFIGLLRQLGLRDLQPQHVVELPNGRHAVLDAALPELRLGFESDGWAFHGSKAQQAADKQRDRQLGRRGWAVHRFVTDDVRRRQHRFLADVLGIIEARERLLHKAA